MSDGSNTRPLLILLPGLDGSGRLFAPLLAALGAGVEARVIAFPADRALGYAELADLVRPQLPADRPFVLLGESFSGPLTSAVLRARFRAVLAVDVRKEAAAIAVPVLALRATRDLVVRPSAGRELLRCMPRATSLELVAPHLLLQIASHAVAAELRRFITDPVGFGMRQTPIVPH